MAYFYVRNDGTATGDGGRYATRQTGDWDATFTNRPEYYEHIVDAMNATTPPADGDFIMISDIHNFNYTFEANINPLGHIRFVSVDDTAIDEYLPGATETSSGGFTNIRYNAATRLQSALLFGLTISGSNQIEFKNNDQAGFMYAQDGAFILNSSDPTNALDIGTVDGANIIFHDIDLQLPDVANLTTGGIRVGNGVNLDWEGGKIIFNTIVADHIFDHAGNGGSDIELSNLDLTNLTDSIFDVDTALDSFVQATVSNCLFPTGLNYNSVPITSKLFKVLGIGNGDADQYYDVYFESYAGKITSDTAVYRDDGATYDGTNKFSLLYSPINIIDFTNVLTVDMPGAWVGDLTNSLTLTLYLVIDNAVTTATTLTDEMFGISISRPDATNQALGIIQSSNSGDVLSTPVELTADTQAWTGTNLTNQKRYRLEVVIPALPGVTNGRVIVEVRCAAMGLDPDDKIYVCPLFEMI